MGLTAVVVSQVLALSNGMCMDGTIARCSIVGCEYAERECVGGRFTPCMCEQWKVVSEVSVPIDYVVVAVRYAIPGSDSYIQYATGSTLGSRSRTLTTTTSGQERSVLFDRLQLAVSTDYSSTAVTGDSGAFYLKTSHVARIESGVDYDPEHLTDEIFVWVNPKVVHTTYYNGSQTFSWGASDAFKTECGQYDLLRVERMPAGMIDGRRDFPPKTACQANFLAFIDSLGSNDRARILGYDPFWVPAEATQLSTNPRFLPLASIGFGSSSVYEDPIDWGPHTLAGKTCASQTSALLTSADATTMKERIIGSSGRTFKVQNLSYSRSWQCTTESLEVLLGVGPRGCLIDADVYLDRMFGTVAFDVVSASAECSRP